MRLGIFLYHLYIGRQTNQDYNMLELDVRPSRGERIRGRARKALSNRRRVGVHEDMLPGTGSMPSPGPALHGFD